MKGNSRVIEILNQVLTNELTGINQYFVHAKMCANWGYHALAAKIRAESIDEMKHADEIIDRILFLDGIPNVQRLGKVNIGQTVPEQLKLDMALEADAVKYLNDSVTEIVKLGEDDGSRELLSRILVSEEEHLDWLEAQLTLIDQIGDKNYLAQQLG